MAWQDRAYNREDRGRRWGGLGFLLPPTPLATALMLACFVVFLLQAFTGPVAGASPTMYFFVPTLEARWGWQRTLAFYTAGAVAAGVTFGLMGLVSAQGGTPLIGASGALLAVIGALAVIAPDMQILLIVIPITMRVLAILYAILYLLSITGDRNLSDAAHLGGLAFGAGAVFFLGPLGNRLTAKYGWDFPPPFEEPGPFSDTMRQGSRPRRSQAALRRARKLQKEEQTEQVKIDQILAKVSAQGMHSLSWVEKRTLKKATERQRKRDAEMSHARRTR